VKSSKASCWEKSRFSMARETGVYTQYTGRVR
jgi:hypothetical protein